MAAFIPLIAGLLPEAIKLIASLSHQPIKEAEAIGPGTGPIKEAQVFDVVKSGLLSAVSAKTLPEPIPPDDLIRIIIKSVVAALNLEGALGGTTVPSVSATSRQALTLKAGQSVTITVAG